MLLFTFIFILKKSESIDLNLKLIVVVNFLFKKLSFLLEDEGNKRERKKNEEIRKVNNLV